MKKYIAIALLGILTTFVVANPASLNEAVNRLVGLGIEQILTQELGDKLMDEAVKQAGNYDDISFHRIYYDARDETYTRAFAGNGGQSFDEYVALRTIVVSKLKEHLHSGDTLMRTYLAERERFAKKVKDADAQTYRKIRRKITDGIACLTAFKNPEIKERYDALESAERTRNRFPDLALLQENLSAKETAEKILAGGLRTKEDDSAEEKFFAQFNDPDLAKFAGRRSAEGGDELVEKYLQVLKLMIEDAF